MTLSIDGSAEKRQVRFTKVMLRYNMILIDKIDYGKINM